MQAFRLFPPDEVDERPCKTRRKMTVDGWDEEEKEEEWKEPTTRYYQAAARAAPISLEEHSPHVHRCLPPVQPIRHQEALNPKA